MIGAIPKLGVLRGVRAVLPCFLLLMPLPLVSQTVYRSVEDGVVTFSDQPPDDAETAEAIELLVPEVSADPDLEARLAAMRESTDRMAEDRRAREKHRAELRATRTASAAGATQVPDPRVVYGGGYWPGYIGGPVRPRPPLHRPPLRPGHPIQPVPSPPPGWSVLKPGNAQLMRPVVSRRQ